MRPERLAASGACTQAGVPVAPATGWRRAETIVEEPVPSAAEGRLAGDAGGPSRERRPPALDRERPPKAPPRTSAATASRTGDARPPAPADRYRQDETRHRGSAAR
ncbi:hypothetical protein LTR94_029046, partial [Friedmanniomyces endolithicus]